jgi:hypothetical protein
MAAVAGAARIGGERQKRRSRQCGDKQTSFHQTLLASSPPNRRSVTPDRFGATALKYFVAFRN